MSDRFVIHRVAAPDPVEKPEKPHRCGRCNNGTGVYNPECPNAQSGGVWRRVSPGFETTREAYENMPTQQNRSE